MKKLVIANWKLNPLTVQEAEELAQKIEPAPKHKTVLCPPAEFLAVIKYPNLGAQDTFWKVKGPYTGQTSPATLKSLGVSHCLVGHSEKRELGETEEVIRAKVEALLEQGITPVLCVGYGTTIFQDDLEVIDTLRLQLDSAVAGLDTKKICVAYEPVWAISHGNPYQTKKMATPEHVEKVALFIKTKYGIDTVLYGGSVTSVNAASFLEQPTIAGLLVGGASLLPDDFNKIINTDI